MTVPLSGALTAFSHLTFPKNFDMNRRTIEPFEAVRCQVEVTKLSSGLFSLSVAGDTVRVTANTAELRLFKRQINSAINDAIKTGRGCVFSYCRASSDGPFKLAVVNCELPEKRLGLFKRLLQWRFAKVLGL